MLFEYLDGKRRERERARIARSIGNIVVGSLVGAAAGVLFAPKSGEETRADIADKSRELAEVAKEKSLDTADTLSAKAYEAQTAVRNTYDDLKLRAAIKADQMKDDAEIAKAKARAIGEIVREEGTVVKEELANSKEEIKKSVKEVAEEAKVQAEVSGEQLKESGEKIAKAAEKAGDKSKKELDK